MAFRYDRVVPWGRSFEEYIAMFDLSERDLRGRILGCGDGPASFNAELRRRGGRVISVDPLYVHGARTIARMVEAAFDDVIAQTRREQHRFVWREIRSVEELGQRRMRAMAAFLSDYGLRRRGQPYLAARLPDLPFADQSFDLALCSHLLFLYSEQLDLELHRAALGELVRVAREVRVFPLLDVNAAISPHLNPLVDELSEAGYRPDIQPVRYEFQRGANQMLRIRREGCAGTRAARRMRA